MTAALSIRQKHAMKCPLCDQELSRSKATDEQIALFGVAARCPKCQTPVDAKRAKTKRWKMLVKTWLELPEDRRC